jgi:hypothetical protein
MATYRIPDLSEKVAFVVGHCEFLRIRQMLLKKDPRKNGPPHKQIMNSTKQGAIAEQLLISPSQWSRIKKGQEAISDVHLARLSEYFDVDRSCDFLVWTKPYEAFTLTLTTLGYGRLRYRATGLALRDFLEARTESDQSGLRIVVVAKPLSSKRGIGAFAETSPFPIELRPGDGVRIAVTGVAGLHYLVLLSREPGGQFTVLAPAAPGVAARVAGQETLLPGGKGTYPVGRPFGPHLLYAILSKVSLALEKRVSFAMPFPTLSNIEEDALRDEIAGHSEEDVRVLCLPYEVIR